ncbi:hypothetical protein EDD11_009432 [Mortierella claussenii]|nr:hypothetical protein EDD11_009432 [Mortierella claussenii]
MKAEALAQLSLLDFLTPVPVVPEVFPRAEKKRRQRRHVDESEDEEKADMIQDSVKDKGKMNAQEEGQDQDQHQHQHQHQALAPDNQKKKLSRKPRGPIPRVHDPDLDEAILESFKIHRIPRIVQQTTWKNSIKTLEPTESAKMMRQFLQTSDQLAMEQSFVNTVAPMTDDVQQIPPPKYILQGFKLKELDAQGRRKMKAQMREQLSGKKSVGVGGSGGETRAESGGEEGLREQVRYSPQCTSCMLQGFECSGHKPICSQCYYSSSRRTLSFAKRSGSLGTDDQSIASSCSYPVIAKPLIPDQLFHTIKDQVTSISSSRHGRTRWKRKRLQAEVDGWDISYHTTGARPLVDKNPAAGLDYLIKSNTLTKNESTHPFVLGSGGAGLLSDSKLRKLRRAEREKKRLLKQQQGRQEGQEQEQQQPRQPSTTDRQSGPEGATIALPLHQGESQRQTGSKATWIEQTLLREDNLSTEKESGIEQRAQWREKGASQLTGRENLIRLQQDAVGNESDYRNETFLSLNTSSKDALMGEALRSDFETRKRLGHRTMVMAKASDARHEKWTVQTLEDKANATGTGEEEEEEDHTDEDATDRPSGADHGGDQAEDVSERPITTGMDVVEVVVEGTRVTRPVRPAASWTSLQTGHRKGTKRKRRRLSPTPSTGSVLLSEMANDDLTQASGSLSSSVAKTRRVKIPKYKKLMAKSFRPWIVKKNEKVIPSACDIPETSLLQALHFYASYYYTHVNPCPDVFEAMDLTSHIALGMIVQEVISDFAFKLGQQSQLEDLEVKKEKLQFSKNLADWEAYGADRLLTPEEEVQAMMEAVNEDEALFMISMYKFGVVPRDKVSIKEMLAPDGPLARNMLQAIKDQREKERQHLERLCKQKSGRLDQVEEDGDLDHDHSDDRPRKRETPEMKEYWAELGRLLRHRFGPDEWYTRRFLVNGLENEDEQKDGFYSVESRKTKEEYLLRSKTMVNDDEMEDYDDDFAAGIQNLMMYWFNRRRWERHPQYDRKKTSPSAAVKRDLLSRDTLSETEEEEEEEEEPLQRHGWSRQSAGPSSSSSSSSSSSLLSHSQRTLDEASQRLSQRTSALASQPQDSRLQQGSQSISQGSQLQERPSFTFASDGDEDEEMLSEHEVASNSSTSDSDSGEGHGLSRSQVVEETSDEDEMGAPAQQRLLPYKKGTAEEEVEDKNQHQEVEDQDRDEIDSQYDDGDYLQQFTQPLSASQDLSPILSPQAEMDHVMASVSEEERFDNDQEGNDVPSFVLTALSGTRFGRKFGSGRDHSDDDDDIYAGGGGEAADDSEEDNFGVISQVVLDDSSSEEDAQVVAPLESEEEDEG